MFLRFDTAIAGRNFAYAPGDVVEWPNDEEAARLVERSQATELTGDEAKETAKSSGKAVRRHRASPTPPENAARRPAETAAAR